MPPVATYVTAKHSIIGATLTPYRQSKLERCIWQQSVCKHIKPTIADALIDGRQKRPWEVLAGVDTPEVSAELSLFHLFLDLQAEVDSR